MSNRKTRRMFAVTLILCMIVSMMPMWPAATVEAATADLEVMIEGSGTKVGNATIAAENALDVFAIPGIDSKGFEQTESGDVNIDYSGGNVYLGADDDPAYVIFTINVADNKTLREMAAGEEAEVVIGFSSLEYYNPALAPTERTTMNISISSPNYTKSYHTSSGRVGASEIVQKFNADSVIEVRIDGTGDYDGDTTGARGFYIKFQDTVRPEIENYTFKGNGEENYNKKITQTELYVKKNEYLDLSYHFTEMVKPTGLIKDQSDFFFKHRLFDNQAGTGLPAEGQTQYMVNQTYNNNNLGTYQKDLQFLYTGVQFHNSSNLPVPIRMGGSGSGDKNAIDYPLEQKIKDAKFADAAGNVAKTDFPFKAKSDSNSHLTNSGNAVDPFDYANGGYRVIVDAVPPKYTKTGNGIQPEILTGLTLNTNDGFDFTLQLTEEAMVKRAWRNEPPLTADKDKVVERTFLLLNNGMKAYYKSGENTDKWTFHLSIPDADGKNVEVPLLKVIALSHDKKNDDSDTGVIQDYAGNLLMQPANYEGIYPPDVSADDRANVNSKIDWANLSFDNTKPLISFHYESGDVTDAVYKQTDKITIDANDPAIKVPGLDPIYQPDAERPSRGIYRPSNVTGGGSPAVGLVYYMWSQSPANPLQYKDDDRFAAIKRYSLSGKQPKEGLYTDGFDNVVLSVANNKTNLLPPPPDALKPEKSGEWYLHAWTSDMTWDSARELMQYDKKKNYDPVKYAQLKAQAPAGSSDADSIIYADKKVLEEITKYGDLTVWPLEDFKHDDSNWAYGVKKLSLDNAAPDVAFGGAIEDNSATVRLPLTITDKQSGTLTVQYQWTKKTESPIEINWTDAVLTAGSETFIKTAEISTLNNVFEDGEYKLYVKTLDNAGNGKTYESPIVTVNSTSTVVAAFTPPANPSYVQSHDVQFAITGLPQMSIISVTSVTYATYVSVGNGVYTLNGFNSRITPASIEVAYAFSELTARPDNTAYIPLDQFTLDGGNWNFTIPKNTGKNGLHYVHVRVKATSTAGTNVYYYSSAYYFDNNAPAVTFSNSGVAYPQASQSVSVTVTETLSRTGLAVSYQWVKDGSPAPDEHSTGWTTFTDTIRAEINNNALQPGEVVDYRLYVYVKDGAGNSYIASSQGIYKVSKTTAELPPAPVKSDLIYTYGDAEDGYTAIVQLGLDQLDNKEGYDYSVSADNGVSWLPWKPYTNFVALKVPTKVAGNLQILVKYRTPGGVIGEPKTLDSRPTTTVEPVYAIATLSTTRSVSRVAGVDIDIALPLGIKAVPTAVNPSVPVRTGNRFHVDTNGFYSFELTDSADSNRKDILYVVVKNIDVTPPNATIEYTPSGTTRGNVTVSLSNASEPIRVINNSGRTSYTFTENGTFEFQYEDEAGNRNTVPAIAKMEKIDKEAPRVNIVRSYAYGENNSKTFNTIKDGNGNVLRSSGLTLEVQKADPSGKEVYVAGSGTPAENRVRTLYQNGVTSFTIYDDLGNMTIIEENVDNIVSEPPKVATVQYAFVDNDGNPLPAEQIVEIDGQQYARGKVKATLSGVVKAPNQVYSGMLDVNSETGIIIPDETRRISGSDGSFSTSRLYAANGTTTVAISDLLGNLNRVPVTVRGLDNTPPTITLNMSSAGIAQNKKEINPRSDLGGYVVSDNVSKPDKIEVTISGLNVEQLGRQRVTYTAKDEVGNTATAQQDVIVVSGDGMLIFANDVLISASSGESALFDSNKLVFNITRFNLVEVKGGQDLINEWGSYDVLYHTGLYREGEMKYIAQKVTYDELISGRYEVTFPEVGWYTIIVRNQEREREYATFFVARKE